MLRCGTSGGHVMAAHCREQRTATPRRQTRCQAPHQPQKRSRYRADSAEVPLNNGSREWWRQRESEHGQIITKSLTINQFSDLAQILNNR